MLLLPVVVQPNNLNQIRKKKKKKSIAQPTPKINLKFLFSLAPSSAGKTNAGHSGPNMIVPDFRLRTLLLTQAVWSDSRRRLWCDGGSRERGTCSTGSMWTIEKNRCSLNRSPRGIRYSSAFTRRNLRNAGVTNQSSQKCKNLKPGQHLCFLFFYLNSLPKRRWRHSDALLAVVLRFCDV